MNNKTATDFLKSKGIHPTEPIYWDFGSNRITLDELLQEFSAQQNKAQQSNIEILRADNKANIEKIEALESELSKQKDKIAELENTNAGFEGIIKSHKEIIKNLDSELTKQKELVEGVQNESNHFKSLYLDLSNEYQQLKSDNARLHGANKDMVKILSNEPYSYITTLKQEIEGLKKEREDYFKVTFEWANNELNYKARIKELEEVLNSLCMAMQVVILGYEKLSPRQNDSILQKHYEDFKAVTKKALSLLSTPTTEPKEEKYTCKKCKREIDDIHEGYCPHCGNVE